MLKNVAELQDFISLFTICTDESILVTLDGSTQEFWLPGTSIPQHSSIENELIKEENEIFGEEITLLKLLSLTRFTSVISKNLTHHVLLLQCNTDHKKKVKNSKKYRGKWRWLPINDFQTKLNAYNCKSPELLYYFRMYTNAYNYKQLSYEKLKFDVFGTSNLFEISENVIINEKTPFGEFIEMASINKSVQLDIYKKFFIYCYPAIYMSRDTFTKLYVDGGWNKSDANALFECADVTVRGGLSYRDFICILAVTEPNKSATSSSEIRNKYIFRFYDADKDNALNVNEFKELLISLKRSKKQLIDENLVGKELDSIFKSLKTTTISYAQYEKLINDDKLKDTFLLLRSGQSLKQTLIKQSTEKSPQEPSVKTLQINKSQVQKSQNQISSVKPNKVLKSESMGKSGGKISFNVALHTLFIENIGEYVNAKEIWSVENAISDSVIKDNRILENEHLLRLSKNTFDKNGTCNELLIMLRTLFDSNKKTYNFRKKDSYQWGDIDKSYFVTKFCEICNLAEAIFANEPRLIYVTSPIYVIGDIHGNYVDLLDFERCFWNLGLMMCPANLLFLGDYVDRGSFSLEVATYLLTYKVLNPSKVILIRGNHEIREIQKMFSFPYECVTKFGEHLGYKVWEAVNTAFDSMPLAAIIDTKIFCCHGGIPPPWFCPVVDAINNIPVGLAEPDAESPLAWELMWNDPVRTKQLNNDLRMELSANEGFACNKRRGTAHVFSEEALEKFFATNGLSHMIRAHEVAVAGFTVHQNCKLFTVFSSSEYCGGQNDAACILILQGKIRMLKINRKNK